MSNNNITQSEESVNTAINQRPDTCPHCHLKINPEFIVANHRTRERIECVFLCTSRKCNKLFIAYYFKSDFDCYDIKYSLKACGPFSYKNREFDEKITSLSPRFVEVFNQAAEAESRRLLEVCGPGYRKSLEFLIKDYLIHVEEVEPDIIKTKLLGNCFKDHFPEGKLKQCAERAIWLGNDATHYERKWDKQDIEDMKMLIELSIHWLLMELMTNEYVQEMPK